MKNYKFCPMLTVYKTQNSIMNMVNGEGAVTVPELHSCIGDECGAYYDGFCNKYMTQVLNGEEGDTDADCD